MQVFGASLIAVPASRLMISLGRKMAFMIGSCLGLFGGFLCVYSLYIGNFWLLVCATLFIGMFNGFGEFIKYAAAGPLAAPIVVASEVSPVAAAIAVCLGSFVAILPNDSFYWLVRQNALVSESELKATLILGGGSILQALTGLAILLASYSVLMH